MSAPPKNHFIFSVYPLHGHTRPLVSIACNLLISHPQLHITLLAGPAGLGLVEKVVAEHTDLAKGDGRLKVVGCLVDRMGLSLEKIWEELDVSVKGSAVNVYTALLNGQTSVFDAGKGVVVEGLCGVKPSLVVCDMFLFFTHKILALAKAQIPDDSTPLPPLYIFMPCPASSVTYHFAGPPHGSVFKDLRPHALAALNAAATFPEGTDEDKIAFTDEFEAIAIQHYKTSSTGALVECPGTPAMFDYEYYPQVTSLPMLAEIARYLSFCVHQAETAVSGVVIPWNSTVLEIGAIEGTKRLVPKLKEVFAVGAQGPASLWDGQRADRASMSAGDIEVLEFLDRAEEKWPAGKRALYISFGSIWFPVLRPDLIVHLLETLLDLPDDQAVPFIFALASPFANLTDDLRERVKKSGRGLLSSFAPQHEVLLHPATGWFLSHAGSNSTSEALICGVPMICWPSIADQPGISAQLTLTLSVAFELLQVRTPPPFLLPLPTARGVTITGTPDAIREEMNDMFRTRIYGEEGRTKRRNVERLSGEIKRDREQGPAREAIEELGRVGLD